MNLYATVDSQYPLVFRKMMTSKLRHSLAAVQAAPLSLSAEVRDQALHILSYALKEDALGLDVAWSYARDLLLALAPRMELMGHRFDWVPFLEQGARISDKRGAIIYLAEFQLQIALIYRLLNHFEQAWQSAKASVDNFAALDQKHNRARALAEVAWIAQEQKNYPEAITSVQEALALLEIHNPENELELGVCYRVLGTIELGLKNYIQAEIHYRDALAIFQRYNDKRRLAWSLNNLALAYSRQHKYLDALTYYEQAATQLLHLNDIYHFAHVRFNQGVAYAEIQQSTEAIPCYEEAAAIYHQFGDKERLSRLQTDIGLARLASHDFDQAVAAFQVSIDLALELGDDSWRLNAMDGLAMAYLGQKEYDEAIKILEKALDDLPVILAAPNYAYLSRSLRHHWQEAQASVGIATQ